MHSYFQKSFSKSSKQIDVKKPNEQKKSISSSILDYKTEKKPILKAINLISIDM